MDLDVSGLLSRYELLGEERDFVAAGQRFERAIAAGEEAGLLTGYGYLLESHARNELRRAVALARTAGPSPPLPGPSCSSSLTATTRTGSSAS